MTQRLSSWDPDEQEALHCISVHDNKRLRVALENWVVQERPRHHDLFFLAACKKQGAGIARMLVDLGFTCSNGPLKLAISRHCWSVVKAVLPVSTNLPTPYVFGDRRLDKNEPLRTAAIHAPIELTRAILNHHADPLVAAQYLLRSLSFEDEGSFDAPALVKCLVEEGVDLNEQRSGISRRVSLSPSIPSLPTRGLLTPLCMALDANRPALALALLRSGASWAGVEHSQERVLAAVLTGRKGLAISPAGWELLDAAWGQGVPPVEVMLEPWPHFKGFGSHVTRIRDDDLGRLKALAQSHVLGQAAGQAPRSSPRSRL